MSRFKKIKKKRLKFKAAQRLGLKEDAAFIKFVDDYRRSRPEGLISVDQACRELEEKGYLHTDHDPK